MSNSERAARFAEALHAIETLYDDLMPAPLIDMLADAMHWCDANGEDFHICLAQACRHYIHELNDEQEDERRLIP